MPRAIARFLFVILGAVLAAALGTLTALVGSRAGKDLLARLVTEQSNHLVRGSVSIGRIEGDFLTHLTLDSVVIRDTTGDLVADVQMRATLTDEQGTFRIEVPQARPFDVVAEMDEAAMQVRALAAGGAELH